MQHFKICKDCWSKWVNERPEWAKDKATLARTKSFRRAHIKSHFCTVAIVDYHHAFDKKGKEVDPGYEYHFQPSEECPYLMEHMICESTKPNHGDIEEWQKSWDWDKKRAKMTNF